MPAAAIVSPAELSAATQGKVLASDPRVQPLLDGATAAIRRWCGWHITPSVTETLVLDGPGGHVLTLPTMYLTTLTSVTEDGVALTPYDPATGLGDYEWSELGNVNRVCGYWSEHYHWTERYRGLAVAIVHGYATAPDVAQIIMQVCANALASPMGATREQAIGFAASWSATGPGVAGGMSLLERDLAVLATYRLRSA